MRIVLTGCSGMVAAAITPRLLAAGHAVIGLDRVTAKRGWGGTTKLHEGVEFRYADMRDRGQFDRHFDGADCVIHLGELPMPQSDAPEVVFATNTRIGSSVARACADHKVPRLVYASTMQTYGFCGEPKRLPASLPATEGHPLRGKNCYALSKIANEAFLKMTAEEEGLSVAALRLPGVTGEHNLKWIRKRIERGDDRTAAEVARYGDFGIMVTGNDTAEAFARLAELDRPGFEAYHVAAPSLACGFTVAELIDGFEVPESHPAAWRDGRPAVPEGWERRIVSCAKIAGHTGWEPTESIELALENV